MAVDLKKPNDELDKFLLRMPDGLREKIKRAAEQNSRSMNSEIVHMLESSLEAEDLHLTLRLKVSELEHLNLMLTQDLELRRKELAKALEAETRVKVLEQELSRQKTVLRDQGKSLLSWEEWAAQKDTEQNTLYVILDADGLPVSWSEAMLHIQSIADATGGNIERIDAALIDSQKAENGLREAQWLKLREFYRAKREA